MSVVQEFEKTVVRMGEDAGFALQMLESAFRADESLMSSVREAAFGRGEEFPFWQLAQDLAAQFDLHPYPVFIYGLCALIFTSLQQTHDHFFAPDGRLWLRRR